MKFLWIGAVVFFSMTLKAEEEVPPVVPALGSEFDAGDDDHGVVEEVPQAPVVQAPKSKPKKVRRSEKIAEGTKAPGRFEADTIPKSVYHLNGRPLDVDPD